MNDLASARRWLREPLVRFLVIGLAFLAVDRAVERPTLPGEDGPEIVVSAGRRAVLAGAFRAEHGREPRAEELRSLVDRWIDEEVLYREALALGLDRRDSIVQRQLVRKMRFLIEDATPLPKPSRAELDAWRAAHAERYGRGPSVSFEQVFLSRARRGAKLETDAARIAEQLRRAPASFAGAGDPFPTGQVVTDADADRLRREFGAGFAEALADLPEGEWAGPVASGFGLHVVRVVARAPFRAAALEEAADRVRVDFDLARRKEQNRTALAELRARYRVAIEDGAG